MSEPRSGGCQCGAIRFRAKSLKDNSHVCHCRMCQKAFGNFFAPLVGVPHSDFEWTRGTPSAFASSEKVERGFCSACGTPLFFRHADNEHISMSIAAFDEPDTIPLAYELGIEGKRIQVSQLHSLPNFGTSEDDDPEGTDAIRNTNRQHPDRDTEDWA